MPNYKFLGSKVWPGWRSEINKHIYISKFKNTYGFHSNIWITFCKKSRLRQLKIAVPYLKVITKKKLPVPISKYPKINDLWCIISKKYTKTYPPIGGRGYCGGQFEYMVQVNYRWKIQYGHYIGVLIKNRLTSKTGKHPQTMTHHVYFLKKMHLNIPT